jgi:hypothetical protein
MFMLNEDNRHTCHTRPCRKGIDSIDDGICLMGTRSIIEQTALNIDHEKDLVHGAEAMLCRLMS